VLEIFHVFRIVHIIRIVAIVVAAIVVRGVVSECFLQGADVVMFVTVSEWSIVTVSEVVV
jgi:hypothetical protein